MKMTKAELNMGILEKFEIWYGTLMIWQGQLCKDLGVLAIQIQHN